MKYVVIGIDAQKYISLELRDYISEYVCLDGIYVEFPIVEQKHYSILTINDKVYKSLMPFNMILSMSVMAYTDELIDSLKSVNISYKIVDIQIQGDEIGYTINKNGVNENVNCIN